MATGAGISGGAIGEELGLADEKSPIGGGQDVRRYQALLAASRFEMLKDTDMTEQISKTFDLLSIAYSEAIQPAWELIFAKLEASNPFVMKLVRWKFGKKIREAEEKHFSGKRDGAHFRRHKTYRRMLYRLRTA